MKCYKIALEISPDDLSILTNIISSLRKQGNLIEALLICDNILKNNKNYNIALYHKERILFSMGKFNESISCCNSILEDYPNNGDVLFDKASNSAMLSNFDDALNLLERAISQGIQYKIKAKKSKSFENLFDNIRFQNLIS
jgi:tetratricopeptide (TPR) repeat protein